MYYLPFVSFSPVTTLSGEDIFSYKNIYSLINLFIYLKELFSKSEMVHYTCLEATRLSKIKNVSSISIFSLLPLFNLFSKLFLYSIAVTKVYYFIHYNGLLQTPGEGGWVSELTAIQDVFREFNLTLTVYQHPVLPNFRHHYMYSLAVESYVYQKSFFQFASQLQRTWMNESQGLC